MVSVETFCNWFIQPCEQCERGNVSIQAGSLAEAERIAESINAELLHAGTGFFEFHCATKEESK